MNNRLVILAGGVSSRMRNPDTVPELSPHMIDEAQRKPKSMIRIGANGRPFMDYLLLNAKQAGISDLVIVINDKDLAIEEYYSKNRDELFEGLKFTFAYQTTPHGRNKPLGTADALLQALRKREDWRGKKFLMCNSDNLYSAEAFKLLTRSESPNALIDYDRDFLEVEPERVQKFAITLKDESGFLTDIIEKPYSTQVEESRRRYGFVGVSMNIFSFSYDMIFPFLESVPMNEIRMEKELPTAVKNMIQQNPKTLFCIPRKEAVPDLTSKQDIIKVKKHLETKFRNL